MKKRKLAKAPYMPHPQTIRRLMRKIRSGWSEAERARRVVGKHVPWTVPEIETPPDGGLDMLGSDERETTY